MTDGVTVEHHLIRLHEQKRRGVNHWYERFSLCGVVDPGGIHVFNYYARTLVADADTICPTCALLFLTVRSEFEGTNREFAEYLLDPIKVIKP